MIFESLPLISRKTMSLFSVAILIQFFIIDSVHTFAGRQESFNPHIHQTGKSCVQWSSTRFHQLDSLDYCPSSLFRCDTTRCLPFAFVCNGEFNCGDRTDEANCSFRCNTSTSLACEQSSRFNDGQPVSICISRWVEFFSSLSTPRRAFSGSAD